MFRFASFLLLAFAACALCACASRQAASNLEVRTTGDARVYGVYTSNPFFTGRR